MNWRKIYLISSGIFFGGVIGIAISLIAASLIHNLLMVIPRGSEIEMAMYFFRDYFGLAVILVSIILFIKLNLKKNTE